VVLVGLLDLTHLWLLLDLLLGQVYLWHQLIRWGLWLLTPRWHLHLLLLAVLLFLAVLLLRWHLLLQSQWLLVNLLLLLVQ
jgi:hypothetical protein